MQGWFVIPGKVVIKAPGEKAVSPRTRFYQGFREGPHSVFSGLVQAIPKLGLHVCGGYWDRLPTIAHYHEAFVLGHGCRLDRGGTKIVINLVRRVNRDGHLARFFEIPSWGAFNSAERRDENPQLLGGDKEEALFGSPAELVEKIRCYLAHIILRERITEAGYRRATNGANSYGDRWLQIMRVVEPLV